MCRSLGMRLEVEAALDELLGLPPAQHAPLAAIGHGHGHAFGIAGQLRLLSRDGATEEVVRSSWPSGPDAYDNFLAGAQASASGRCFEGHSMMNSTT